MKTIESLHNDLIKDIRKLKENSIRNQRRQLIIEGEKMLLEALGAGVKPVLAIVDSNQIESYSVVLKALESAGTEMILSPEKIIEALTDTKSPQGILAVIPYPKQLSLDDLPDKLIVLDGVQDPGNVGTIIRTADAAGFGGLIFNKACADPFNAKTLRSTMGSIFRIPTFCTDPLEDLIVKLVELGYCAISSEMNGSDFYSRADVGKKIALIIGNESIGVSHNVSNVATMHLKLPMYGGAESLNAAIAAAIMMYELVRK